MSIFGHRTSINGLVGEYPELPRSEPVLFSSIFNAFRHKDVNQECTSMLIENWRMNQVTFWHAVVREKN